MQFNQLRQQFPTLNQSFEDGYLCYLDNAATSQKPQQVIDAINRHYQQDNANVHRSGHRLSRRTTTNYEAVRDKVRAFINAADRTEIVFTHGTTGGINLVAHGLTQQIKTDAIILLDTAAHHANIVPWQMLAQRTGAKIVAIPLDENYRIDQAAYTSLLAQRPTIVAIGHVSNVLGTVSPVAEMVKQAKAAGAITVIDGAQAIAHIKVDVQAIDCDFYLFSVHKMYGPTGVGILYGRYDRLNQLTPLITGGEMVKSVSFEHTEFNQLPNKLEAGTPPISAVIGLSAAIDFLNSEMAKLAQQHEIKVLNYLQQTLAARNDVELYGAHKDNRVAVAFNLIGEHHQDVGILLDQQGIAIRCGHHCAMPLMQVLNIKGCCRVSIGIYTSMEDIDRFIAGLNSVTELLR